MMTSDERFALVWQKVERANKHIADLETATIAFCKTGPVEMRISAMIKRKDQSIL